LRNRPDNLARSPEASIWINETQNQQDGRAARNSGQYD
jgi:hypothetical protein